MSKIGKINIAIPEKVKVSLDGSSLKMEGPMGKDHLKMDINIFELNIVTLRTALSYLSRNNGSFVIKTFQNSLLKKLRTEMEKSFHLVQTYKPAASKSKSAEIYLYGEKPL